MPAFISRRWSAGGLCSHATFGILIISINCCRRIEFYFTNKCNGLSNLTPHLLRHRSAHQILLHFPGDGHRELVNETDIPRNLIMGDLVLAERFYLVLR